MDLNHRPLPYQGQYAALSTPVSRPEVELHLVVDNLATQIRVHFTPTSGSWLNLVEVWFSMIERQAIRRGSFISVRDLMIKIRAFIDGCNRRKHPFIWTKTPTEILAKLDRKRKHISAADYGCPPRYAGGRFCCHPVSHSPIDVTKHPLACEGPTENTTVVRGQLVGLREPTTPSIVRSREWLYVLTGELRLVLDGRDLVILAGEAAEFDTRTPHTMVNAATRPTELIIIFGQHVHLQRATGGSDSCI